LFALVITGGLAVAPAMAQAPGGLDMGKAASPIVPLPLYNSRPESGGFYTALEFVMFRMTRNFQNQVVARRGLIDLDGSVQADLRGTFITPIAGPPAVFVPGAPGRAGTFLGSGVQALNVQDLNSSDLTYAPGLEVTFGWRFADGSAVEFRGFNTREARYNVGADIIPPNTQVDPQLFDTFLTANVFNFPVEYAGHPHNTALGNGGATYGIWNAAQSMTIEMVQRYTQYDLLYRRPVLSSDVSRTHIVMGARFSWIWERFLWRTVDADLLGNSDAENVAIYTNIVSNRMYGPVLGCQHELYLGHGLAIMAQLDGAANVDVVKERAQYERADRQTENKKSVTEYTFAPSLNGELYLTWYPIEGVQLRLGWNSVMFFNTVDAPTPISFNFGNLAGVWQRQALRYMDGIKFGAAISF
jgi:hypothetical protein